MGGIERERVVEREGVVREGGGSKRRREGVEREGGGSKRRREGGRERKKGRREEW